MPPAAAREKETPDKVDNQLDFLLPTASASTEESLNGQKSDDQIEDEGSNIDDVMEAECSEQLD